MAIVAAEAKVTPGHDLAIPENGGKRATRGVDLSHAIADAISDSAAVPTIPGITPGDDGTIGEARSIGTSSGRNLAARAGHQ